MIILINVYYKNISANIKLNNRIYILIYFNFKYLFFNADKIINKLENSKLFA